MGRAGFQYAGPKEELKELSRRRGELLEQLRTPMRRVEGMRVSRWLIHSKALHRTFSQAFCRARQDIADGSCDDVL
jgi:hypothetical protein